MISVESLRNTMESGIDMRKIKLLNVSINPCIPRDIEAYPYNTLVLFLLLFLNKNIKTESLRSA